MRTFAHILRPRSRGGSSVSQVHAGVVAIFEPRVLADGRAVDYAEVDVSLLDDAEWGVFVARMARMPGYSLLRRRPVMAEDKQLMEDPILNASMVDRVQRTVAHVPPPAKSAGADHAPADGSTAAHLVAMVNGWTAEDLDGTGMDGEPGVKGGHSAMTGLTLGEMALSVPPADWAEAKAVRYPWEDPTWTRPPGFVMRSAPAKVSTQPAPDTSLMKSLDVVDQPTPASMQSAAPEADSEPPMQPPATSDLGELATPEVLAAIQGIVSESSDAPTLRKVNFRLNELGLKKLTGVQLAAILAALSPSP